MSKLRNDCSQAGLVPEIKHKLHKYKCTYDNIKHIEIKYVCR